MLKMNVMRRASTTTHDNGDGTVTTITTSYNLDGTKVTKKKTLPKHIPENVDRGTGSPVPARRASYGYESLEQAAEQVKSELRKVLGVPHSDNHLFENKVARAIPAEIVLIASQDDVTQAQESDSARRKYELPDIPNTRSDSGSLATCALLQMFFEDPKRLVAGNSNKQPYNYRQLLQQIQTRVKQCSSLQQANPVISSSRPLGPPALKGGQFAPFYIVPPGFTGTRRALLICVVSGEGHDLKGPPNDIQYVHHFLTQHCGFKDKDIIQLRDDQHAPASSKRSTKQNILDGFSKMVRMSNPNDVLFIQYTGHGGRLGDNLYILPSDYKENGQIMDDDILKDLIKFLPEAVHCTMLVDCCYSGVIGDLPYSLHSNKKGVDIEQQQTIGSYYDTDTREEMIEHEELCDEDYKAKQEARSKWRNMNRIATVAKEMAKEAAEKAKEAAEKASKAAGEASKVASKAAGEYGKVASKAAGEYGKVASKAAGEYGKVASKAAGKAAVSARERGAQVRQSAGKAAEQARNKAADFRRSQTTDAVPRGRKRTDDENASRGVPPMARPTSPMNRSKTVGLGHSPPRQRPQPQAQQQKPALRRVATAPAPHAMPSIRRTKTNDTANAPSPAMPSIRRTKTNDTGNVPSPAMPSIRRTKTTNDTANVPSAPYRPKPIYVNESSSSSKPTVRRTKTNEEIAREQEEAARRAAVAQSRRDANQARTQPQRARSTDGVDYESAARRAAVERSRREAAEARANKMGEESPRDYEWEEAARREAVERSRREAAAARGAKMDESVREQEEAARREAVERSRREAAEEAARKEAVERSRREAAEEAARREAVERSRREAAEEAARREAVERSRREALEEAARREAVERSKREAAEEAARREAVERSKREAAEEAARREAVERKRREAEEEAARKEAVERSRREAASEHDEAARREAVERSKREAAAARGKPVQ